jgi:hypothetical protein
VRSNPIPAYRRDGSYDPRDNEVNWEHRPKPGEDPKRDRTMEPSGPTYLSTKGIQKPRRSSFSESESEENRLGFAEISRGDHQRQGYDSSTSGVTGRGQWENVDCEEVLKFPVIRKQRKANILVYNSSNGDTGDFEATTRESEASSLSFSAACNSSSGETTNSKKLEESSTRTSEGGMALQSTERRSSQGSEIAHSLISRIVSANVDALESERVDILWGISGEIASGKLSKYTAMNY